MKKFLLSCLAVSSLFYVNAEIKTVSYDFANETYGLTRESGSGPYIDNGVRLEVNDGIEITLTKTEGKNGWRLWSDGLRVYKNSDAGMVVATNVGAIKKIEFTAKSGVIAEIGSISVSGGSYGVACNGNNIPLSFNVSNNGAIFTMTITVDTEGTGTSTDISSINGEVDPPIVEPEVTIVNSVAETLKVAAKTKVKVNYPLLVAFVNNNNCYARDEAGDFIQVYGKNSYKADDIIPAGWEATYDLYNGTPELMPVSLPESTEQGTFIPKRYEASQIDKSMVNNVIVVTNVTFDEATPDTKTNFTGTSGDVTLTFRNNYTIASVDAGTYDVNCLVNVYQDAVQLYALNYFPAEGSGIDAIVADGAAAEYFTLQGVKVANPTEGLYIVVKNGKANKVLVK